MTQEDKELLIRDLCARLPYGVKSLNKEEIITIRAYISDLVIDEVGISHDVEDCKPYLFPLSSMTEEQDKEYALLQTSAGKEGFLYAWNCATMMKWLIENHFDYNGLIPKGLAEDATDKNIY